MRKIAILAISVFIFIFIHEGTHVLVSLLFNEYEAFMVHLYGFEVIFKTPVPDREGIHWAFISGTSNVITLALGYLLLCNREKISKKKDQFVRATGYYMTVIFLMFDPLNLSLAPYLFGGDVFGISKGLQVNVVFLQAIFLTILLVNRELIIIKLFPMFSVNAKSILWKPLFSSRLSSNIR